MARKNRILAVSHIRKNFILILGLIVCSNLRIDAGITQFNILSQYKKLYADYPLSTITAHSLAGAALAALGIYRFYRLHDIQTRKKLILHYQDKISSQKDMLQAIEAIERSKNPNLGTQSSRECDSATKIPIPQNRDLLSQQILLTCHKNYLQEGRSWIFTKRLSGASHYVACSGSKILNRLGFGLGDYQPETIVCVIVDSPLASHSQYIRDRFQSSYIRYIPGAIWLTHIGLMYLSFLRYGRFHLDPIDSIEHIPSHIPILFIGRWNDPHIVPEYHVIALYKKARALNLDAYLLIIPHSKQNGQECHLACPNSSKLTCRSRIELATQVFYKQYCQALCSDTLSIPREQEAHLLKLCKPNPNMTTTELYNHFQLAP